LEVKLSLLKPFNKKFGKSTVKKKYLLIVVLSLLFSACASNKLPETDRLSKAPVPDRLQQAGVALNNKDYSNAQRLYQEVIEELVADDVSIDGKKLEGSSSSKKSRKKSDKKKEKLDPELKQDYLSTAYTGMGVIAEQASNYPVAKEMFKGALQAKADNISAQEGLALVTLNEGKIAEARQSLNDIMDKTSEAPRWRTLNALGVISDLEGKYDEAFDYYKKSEAAGGAKEQALNNQAYSKLMSGEKETALKIFSGALRQYPNSERLNSNYALTLARMGDYDKARKAWAKVLEKEEAWNNTGYVAMLNGDLKVAREHLEKALEVAPRFYEAAESNLEKLKTLEEK
jgi:tetratricopeptide (TPR) repeat protein